MGRIADGRAEAAQRTLEAMGLAPKPPHICQPEHCASDGMRNLYAKLGVYPSSEHGDVILIRSHIAYWSGSAVAERALIKPSRGHTYRVTPYGSFRHDVI